MSDNNLTTPLQVPERDVSPGVESNYSESTDDEAGSVSGAAAAAATVTTTTTAAGPVSSSSKQNTSPEISSIFITPDEEAAENCGQFEQGPTMALNTPTNAQRSLENDGKRWTAFTSPGSVAAAGRASSRLHAPNSILRTGSPSLGGKRWTPFLQPAGTLPHLRGTQRKLMLGMVGLPARGKTFIAHKLARYLNWLGYKSRVFNIGNYRRELYGAEKDASFFDPENKEAVEKRTKSAVAALEDMFEFMRNGGHAAIYDGTNSTISRRQLVVDTVSNMHGDLQVDLVWIESICDDEAVISANILATKLGSPDYANMDPSQAIKDFRERIDNYKRGYEPVQAKDQSWVKLMNAGHQVTANNIYGYLPTRIVFFLMNLRMQKKPIYLSRHGLSEYNVLGKLGGDSPITDFGHSYAAMLDAHLQNEPEVKKVLASGSKLSVWCSCLRRTIETASYISNSWTVKWHSLNEIDAGVCDGLTYDEVKQKYPDDFEARAEDKLRYRYPQGESYMDVIARLENVIFELERSLTPVVVVAHQAVLRCLYAYFHDMDAEDVPHVSIPIHTLIKLTPAAYGSKEDRTTFDVDLMPPKLRHSASTS
jgi:6-phosphofructo-2-kinase / fructose-2,6-biphosphatase 2